MNSNTFFRVNEVAVDQNSELLYTRTREVDFQFQAYKIVLAINTKKLKYWQELI